MRGMSDTTALPTEALTELHEALRRLRQGGGAIMRGAQALATRAMSPLLRQLGGRIGADALDAAARAALERAYRIAILGLQDDSPLARRANSAAAAHLATATSGLVSGASGLIGAVPDAAFTTLVIMRQIAREAREQGEDLSSEDARRACLEVFALQPGSEASYWSARLLLRAEPLAALLGQAARAWSAVLAEKLAAQAAPLVGALGGATVNTAFLVHYRVLARGHFTVRRLERQYGAETVRAAAAAMAPD